VHRCHQSRYISLWLNGKEEFVVGLYKRILREMMNANLSNLFFAHWYDIGPIVPLMGSVRGNDLEIVTIFSIAAWSVRANKWSSIAECKTFFRR
jgi:hypothetical protein